MQTARARLLLIFSLMLGTTGWAAEGETPSDHHAQLHNQNSGLDSAFQLLQVESLPDGVVKEFSSTSSAQPGSPILPVKYDTIAQGNHRVKRHGRIRKVFRKLKKLLPGGGSIIAQAKPNRRFHIA